MMSNLSIKRVSLQNGSCNFCKRGGYDERGDSLTYPYKEVIEIQGKHNCCLAVRFCDRCLKEIGNYLNS
ncbi:hypothetical protein KAR91_46440 [Candidatus Pacearchaeota archaeon]|nr:hypothetical protein [Candidatus Pacearchaeota archaeon]